MNRSILLASQGQGGKHGIRVAIERMNVRELIEEAAVVAYVIVEVVVLERAEHKGHQREIC